MQYFFSHLTTWPSLGLDWVRLLFLYFVRKETRAYSHLRGSCAHAHTTLVLNVVKHRFRFQSLCTRFFRLLNDMRILLLLLASNEIYFYFNFFSFALFHLPLNEWDWKLYYCCCCWCCCCCFVAFNVSCFMFLLHFYLISLLLSIAFFSQWISFVWLAWRKQYE